MKNKRQIVIGLLLLFLLLRIVIVIIVGQRTLGTGDSGSYNSYALAILQNSDWLTNPQFHGDYRTPIYPFFIAIIYLIFGINNFVAVYFFQVITSILTCLYIYKFSKKIFDDKVAVLSLIWAGCYIFYLYYVGILLRETLIFFFIIALFYHLYLFLIEEYLNLINFCIFSILYFLLIHTDPRYLFYLPFLISLFIIYQPIRIGLKKYFIFIGITILLMIPWTIRNYIAYDGFVLINKRTLDLTNPNASIRLQPLKMEEITPTTGYPTEEEREIIINGGNPNNRSPEEVKAIKKGVRAPNSLINRRLWNLKEQWRVWKFSGSYRPWGDFRGAWSLKHNVSSSICYGSLLPFMVFSIFYLIRKKEKIVWFLLFPPIIQTILHVLMWGKDRYRIPIDSFVIILGVYGMWLVYQYVRSQKNCLQKECG